MVFEKICAFLAEQMGISADTITTDTDIVADLGADSLDVVELIASAEDEYGISISDEVVMNFKTVGDVVDYIESQI